MEQHSNSSQLHNFTWLYIEDFEYLCFNTAKTFLTFNEPIPDYDTRDNSLLDSALALPRQTFGNELLYSTLEKQAAILFYALIKNHPFKNGNKRIAVMSLLAFLTINNMWLRMDPTALYNLACRTAESDASKKNTELQYIETLLLKHFEHMTD